MKEKLFLSLILFLTFLAWAPTLSTYFSQDDWVFLSHVYKQPFSSVFKHYQEAFYRPVGQQLFFFLGINLFGLEAQGFHLIGLAIHLFNIWLLSRILNIWDYPSTRTPRGWLKGTKGLRNGAFGAGFRPDRLEDSPQLAAGRPHDRRGKYFLLTFYAVNPAHFVALNWLTQMDIEIAVGFGLLTILFWKKTVFSLGFFLAALLSHETVVMLPIAMAFWASKGPTSRGRTLMRSAAFFGLGVLVLAIKFLVNPFSLQSDYSFNFNLVQLLSTLKWYALRALAIPEGVRNLPVWLAGVGLIPGLILTLIFRRKLARGLGVYLLGVLPVLGFGSHLLAAYAIFGIALMVIELGKSAVIPAKAGIYLNRFRIKSGMTVFLGIAVVWLAAAGFIYSNYSNHWSTTRGIISRRLTEEYTRADSETKKEMAASAGDFKNNPEVYFSSMMGRQFEVLDRGAGRGVFDILFYRGNDMASQFLPDALFFRDSILAGKFPAWNPWIFGGMPYWLDPQNFLWYPPNYIFLLAPIEIGFFLLLIGHLALAGWGVKRVLGEFGIFGKLGILGGLMFVLSPKLAGHIEEGNWTLLIAACWLPILYLALKKRKFWGTTVSLSAIIINNLNIGYYAVLFILLHFLMYRRQERSLPAETRRLLKILITAAVLTIPRWLPLVLYGNQTVRAGLNEAPLPLWSWTKIIKSLFFPLAPAHPVLQNEEILYLGVIPMMAVALGGGVIEGGLRRMGPLKTIAFRRVKKLGKEGRFWAIWLALVFFIALNNKTPLFHLIKRLPGFSLLRITTRPWIFTALGMAVGVPIVIRQIWEIRQIRGIRMSKRFSNFAIAVLSGLIIMEFGWFDWNIFARRKIVSDPVPAGFYRQMAADGAPVRAYCTTGCLDRLAAQKMGIYLLGGNNPVQTKSFVEYLQRAGGYREPSYHPILPPYTVFSSHPQPDAGLLRRTGTEFVVSPYELTDEMFEFMGEENGFRLYKNR